MVHVLAVVAVITAPLLLAVRRIVGAVQIEQQVRLPATADPLAFAQVDAEQRMGQAVAGAAVDGILQAGESGLTGQIRARVVGIPTAHELEQRVAAQGVGVVLVLVATGDLQEALAHQEGARVADRAATPLRDLGSEGGGQA